MIARPDFIKLNGLVKVNGFVGRIVDLAESEQSLGMNVRIGATHLCGHDHP